MPKSEDQTEAELEKTRRVVAEQMAEQIATNDGTATTVADEPEPVEDEPASKASKKGGR